MRGYLSKCDKHPWNKSILLCVSSLFFLSSFPLIFAQTLAAGRWPLAGGPCLHCNWSVRGSVLRTGDQVQNSHHLFHCSPQHCPVQVSPWSRSQTKFFFFAHALRPHYQLLVAGTQNSASWLSVVMYKLPQAI